MKLRNKLAGLLCGLLCLSLLAGCSGREPFRRESITISQLQEMLAEKQTFNLAVEREQCPFCEAMNQYMTDTSEEHPDEVLYVIDITAFDCKKATETSTTLISSTMDGKNFLKIFPYFYYTPTIYKIQDGRVKEAGIGWNNDTKQVSLWNTTSSIDWNSSKGEDLWTFLARDATD